MIQYVTLIERKRFNGICDTENLINILLSNL